MTTLIKNNPKILSSPELLKLNRCISYMSFIIKEIYDYMLMKSSDGKLIFHLRNLKINIQHKMEINEKLKSLLK